MSSKIDWTTTLIVTVCALAIGVLSYKAYQLYYGDKSKAAVTQPVAPDEYVDTVGLSNTMDDPDDDDIEILDEEDSANTSGSGGKSATGTSSGTATTANTKPAPTEVPTSYDANAGEFLVLAGSFRQKINAQKEMERLRKMGFDDAKLGYFNKGSFATVVVDRYDSKSQAQSLVNQLKAKGVESYVHKKRRKK